MTEADSKEKCDLNDPVIKVFVTDSNKVAVPKKSEEPKEEFTFEKLLTSEVISDWEIIGRYLINMSVNIINLAIANTCLIYVLASAHNNSVRLHIACSVIGFQFCMNQSILMMSNYNFWAIRANDKMKRQIQWYLQAIGCVLILWGGIIIYYDQRANTYTPHGKCGIYALLAYLLGYFNDRIVLTLYILFPNFKPHLYIVVVKCVHYASSIATALLHCLCLCYGFNTYEFQYWAREEEIRILTLAAYIVTTFVIIELFNTSIGNIIDILELEFHEEHPIEDNDSDVYVPLAQSKE